MRNDIDDLLHPGGKSRDHHLNGDMTLLDRGVGHGKTNHHYLQELHNIVGTEDGPSEKAQKDIRTGNRHHADQGSPCHPIQDSGYPAYRSDKPLHI